LKMAVISRGGYFLSGNSQEYSEAELLYVVIATNKQ